MIIKILENEYWYGPDVCDGLQYPFGKDCSYKISLNKNKSVNQVAPLLLSTLGRYIWCDSEFDIETNNGNIIITNYTVEPILWEKGTSLRDAFKEISDKHFNKTGNVPPEQFFKAPQYNTWMELGLNQTQEGVIKYAKAIIENGLPSGILMIDDIWSDYYGTLEFNSTRFPAPKDMIKELKKMGFKVMLWTCPFITPDTIIHRELSEKGYLVKNKDGDSSLKKWWNGFSAVLDLSNPEAFKWYKNKLDTLVSKYDIDGFKFDAGDAYFYSDNDVTYGNVKPNTQSELWAKLGLDYAYNEYRACYKMSGTHLVQRLHDKNHSWDSYGVKSLIPNTIAQSMIGHNFICPDMVGGGEYYQFQNVKTIDEELFVRYAQCSALMPMMQISTAPWRILDEKHFNLCKEMALLHTKYGEYIYKLALESLNNNDPIVTPMCYYFQGQGLEKVNQQFMLGKNMLIAPVIEPNCYQKEVYLPIIDGQWEDELGNRYEGGQAITVHCDLNMLKIFSKYSG